MEINPANEQLLGLNGRINNAPKMQPQNIDKQQAVTLDKSYENYISKALSARAIESIDIEQIRNEIKSGQLDNPEAIRQAAQNILRQGI